MDASRAVQTIVARWPNVVAVYIFGSRARGVENQASDLDLAVLARTSLDGLERWNLAQDVSRQLGRDVDLVDLTTSTTVFVAEVLREARVLFDSDSNARATFEMTALSEYADLNERRAGILEDVKARGRVHG